MVPWMLAPGAAVFCGILAAESWCWTQWSEGEFPFAWLIASAIAVLVLFLSALAARRMLFVHAALAKTLVGVIFVGASSFVLGAALGCASYLGFHERITEADMLVNEATVHIVGDLKETGAGSGYSRGEVELAGGQRLAVRLFWPDSLAGEEVPSLGQTCTVHGSFSPLKATDAQRYLHEQQVGGSFSVTRVEDAWFGEGPLAWAGIVREKCRRTIEEATSATARVTASGTALLEGVLLGYRTGLDGSCVQADYNATGLSHLLAVSGTHLAVFSAVLLALLEALHLHRCPRMACSLAAVAFYVFLTGLQPSAIRAGLMVAVTLAVWSGGRRKQAFSVLCAVAAGMLAFEPANAFSAGFRLSVCSCIGIVVFTPLMVSWIEAALGSWGRNKRVRSAVVEPCGITLVAQAVTSPLTVPMFSQLSLVAPLANVAVVPVVTALITGGFVALGVYAICPTAGSVALGALGLLADACNGIVSWLAALPCACVPCTADPVVSVLLAIGCMTVVYLVWPLPTRELRAHVSDAVAEAVTDRHARTPAERRARMAIVSSLAACAIAVVVGILLAGNETTLTVMDVGQGDAILVRDCGGAVLVDTGPSDTALVSALARNSTTSLDAVVLTHFDNDHCGAIDALRNVVPVGCVLMSEGSLLAADDDASATATVEDARMAASGGDVREVGDGTRIRVGPHIELIVLWPEEPIGESSNENSIVTLLCYDGDEDGTADATALLTGDAEAQVIEEVLEATGMTAVDILKVPHHGSRPSLAEGLLDDLTVRTAVISVGADNRYGHPKPDTLATLDEHGVDTYRTDEGGDVCVTFDMSAYTVACGVSDW